MTTSPFQTSGDEHNRKGQRESEAVEDSSSSTFGIGLLTYSTRRYVRAKSGLQLEEVREKVTPGGLDTHPPLIRF